MGLAAPGIHAGLPKTSLAAKMDTDKPRINIRGTRDAPQVSSLITAFCEGECCRLDQRQSPIRHVAPPSSAPSLFRYPVQLLLGLSQIISTYEDIL